MDHDIVDICRTGIYDVGGIMPAMKTVGLCESFSIPLELHGGGAGHLQILGAMGIPGEYYECGLLHPEVEYTPQPPWLDAPVDPMDDDGYVHIPQHPGLSCDISAHSDMLARRKIVRGWRGFSDELCQLSLQSFEAKAHSFSRGVKPSLVGR